ncbi:GAF domain-containing protein [Chloroflexota bacterium]
MNCDNNDIGIVIIVRRNLRVVLDKMKIEHGVVFKSAKTEAQSDNYLRAIMNSLEDELLVIDKDYCILDVNDAVVTRHRKSRSEIIGKTCHEVSHGLSEVCSPPCHECPVDTVWKTGKVSRATHVHIYDDGDNKDRYIDIIASPIFDGSGNVTAVVELMRDITTAKTMESRVSEAYQSLLALNTIASAVSQSLDLGTVLNTALEKTLEIMKLNTGCILLWDETRQSLCYKVHHGLSDGYVQTQFCSLGDGIAGQVAKTGKAIIVEGISAGARDINYALSLAEGLQTIASVPLFFGERVLGVLSIATRETRKFSSQDIQLLESIAAQIAIAVENAKLHQEVQRKEEIRGELLREIFSIQEEERRRIARELHDETSQSLASLVANLETVSELLEVSKERAAARLGDAQSLSIGILDEIHRIIYELRPTLLDDLGLVSAIRWLVDNNLRAQGIFVDFKTTGRKKRIPPQIETTLFRVIQETVSNIARHSCAKNVTLNLHFKKEGVRVKINDDGKGFDVEEAINSRERPRGLGLLGMRERVELMNGNLNIYSGCGAGTEVNITIPADSEVSNE